MDDEAVVRAFQISRQVGRHKRAHRAEADETDFHE